MKIIFAYTKTTLKLKMVEMFYEGMLQLKTVIWAVELKVFNILDKIKAGNKPGSVLTSVSRDHSSGTAVTDRL